MDSDSGSTNIVTLKSVYKKYGNEENFVVSDFSLNIKKGEFFCFVGPSGCGKSTILKIIAGLEEPTSGSVDKPQNISVVFQSGALFPWMSVVDNVAFGLKMSGIKTDKIEAVTAKYLKMVELEGYEKKYPRELSGGQRQRVGIARALAVGPEVLILDEPFSALDPITTEELHKDLLAIWKKSNFTIIMVSHLLAEAVHLADRIGIMNEGRLVGLEAVNLPRPRPDNPEKVTSLIKTIRGKFF